jgi:hypothetical protein
MIMLLTLRETQNLGKGSFQWTKSTSPTVSSYRQKAARSLWFRELNKLNQLNQLCKIGIDLQNWNSKYLGEIRKSSHGNMPAYSDQKQDILD